MAIRGLQVTHNDSSSHKINIFDFVYYTDATSHIMTALTASLHAAAGTFPFKLLLIQKHGFIRSRQIVTHGYH